MVDAEYRNEPAVSLLAWGVMPRLILALASAAYAEVGGIAPAYTAMFRHNVPLLVAAMLRNRSLPAGKPGK